MEDTQIIALYLSRQEAAIGETAKKYGGYINQMHHDRDRPRVAADEGCVAHLRRNEAFAHHGACERR